MMTSADDASNAEQTGSRQSKWRPRESMPSYIAGAFVGGVIGANQGGLDDLLFGALFGGAIVTSIAQFGGLVIRYVLFFWGDRTSERREFSEPLAAIQAILIGKILGLLFGGALGWIVVGQRALWIPLVCGLTVSTRWGEIGSELATEFSRWHITRESRRIVYLYYALETACLVVCLGVAARAALLIPNLALMYCVLLLGTLLAVGLNYVCAIQLGIMPPWVLSPKQSFGTRAWAARRYPPLTLFPELVESRLRLDAMLAAIQERLTEQTAQPGVSPESPVADSDAGDDESISAARLVSARAELLTVLANRVQAPATEVNNAADAESDEGVDEGVLEDWGSDGEISRDIAISQPSHSAVGSILRAAAARGQASQAPSDPKWRAADSNIGLFFGLIVGACDGADASIVGALVLGQIVPALRRFAEAGRLATTIVVIGELLRRRNVGSDTTRSLALSTASEMLALIVGGLLGVVIALTIGGQPAYVVAVIGACCAYSTLGGAGYHLAHAMSDVRILPTRMALVSTHYAVHAAFALGALALGLAYSAPINNPLLTLSVGAIGCILGAVLADALSAALGVLPPWKWKKVGGVQFRRWATRSYIPTPTSLFSRG